MVRGTRCLLALLLPVGLTACLIDAPPPPDILIVVIDTLRQDRVGVYGYESPTTPFLDILAVGGTRYQNARSTSSWTSPAHASLFTGLYAAAHGATQEQWDLREDLTTLAEILQAKGYRTIAGVGNPMLADSRGFGQGFEEYEETWRGAREGGPGTDSRSLAWLARRLPARDERPQLVFVNLIGIHNPYDSCGTHCGSFGAALDDGPTSNQWRPYYLGRIKHDASSLDRISRLYDAEVRQADDMLQAVYMEFRAAAGDRPTLIIATSDHGENLGDHGHIDHAFSIHESLVRVPLIVLGPGFPVGAVDTSPVQIHDLFPTVLQAAGIDLAAHPSQGLPLTQVPDDRVPFMEYYLPVQTSRSLAEIAVQAELPRIERWQHRLRAVVQDGTKLIWSSDGSRQLYDLRNDPDETRDRSAGLQGTAESGRLEELLLAQLARVARDNPARGTTEVDEETRRALEALGYIQ